MQFSDSSLSGRHIAEDLIKRKLYYTFSKKYELVNIFDGKLFNSPEDVERLRALGYVP